MTLMSFTPMGRAITPADRKATGNATFDLISHAPVLRMRQVSRVVGTLLVFSALAGCGPFGIALPGSPGPLLGDASAAFEVPMMAGDAIFDASGHLVVIGGAQTLRISSTGQVVATLDLQAERAAAAPSGEIWLCNSFFQMRKYASDGRKLLDVSLSTKSDWNLPAMAVDPAGRLWASEPGRTVIFNERGERLRTIEAIANDIVIGPDGNAWLFNSTRLAKVSPEGTQLGAFTFDARFSSNNNTPVTIGSDGQVWVADLGGNVLYRLAADGSLRGRTTLPSPLRVAAGSDGTVWVHHADRWELTKLDSNGQPVGHMRLPIQTGMLARGADGPVWIKSEPKHAYLSRLTIYPLR
jgi:streptogramin lyase